MTSQTPDRPVRTRRSDLTTAAVGEPAFLVLFIVINLFSLSDAADDAAAGAGAWIRLITLGLVVPGALVRSYAYLRHRAFVDDPAAASARLPRFLWPVGAGLALTALGFLVAWLVTLPLVDGLRGETGYALVAAVFWPNAGFVAIGAVGFTTIAVVAALLARSPARAAAG